MLSGAVRFGTVRAMCESQIYGHRYTYADTNAYTAPQAVVILIQIQDTYMYIHIYSDGPQRLRDK